MVFNWIALSGHTQVLVNKGDTIVCYNINEARNIVQKLTEGSECEELIKKSDSILKIKNQIIINQKLKIITKDSIISNYVKIDKINNEKFKLSEDEIKRLKRNNKYLKVGIVVIPITTILLLK